MKMPTAAEKRSMDSVRPNLATIKPSPAKEIDVLTQASSVRLLASKSRILALSSASMASLLRGGLAHMRHITARLRASFPGRPRTEPQGRMRQATDEIEADMNASLQAVLSDSERLLVAETEKAQLGSLDEDAAVELHTRIRRARNKYVGLYRRSASAKVAEKGGRGKARPENKRAAMKAEAFEDALARVSRRVAALARQSAARLRRERLDAARASKTGSVPSAPRPPASPKKAAAAQVPDRASPTPDLQKRRATTRAIGARRQAKKDSR